MRDSLFLKNSRNLLVLLCSLFPASMALAAEPLPDLIPLECSFSPANPTANDQIVIGFKVKNQGTGMATLPAGTTIVRMNNGTSGGGSKSEPNQIFIPPGSTYDGTISLGTLPKGAQQINFVVDPSSMVTETSESNNSMTCTINVADFPKSDLVITDVRFEPVRVAPNKPFKAYVTIKNQGSVAAYFPSGSAILYDDRYGNFSPDPGTTVTGESIAAGASKTIIYNNVFGTPVTRDWTFTVDPKNIIIESDKKNNKKVVQLIVDQPAGSGGGTPDLMVTDCSFTKYGQDYGITVKFKNQGTGTAVFPISTPIWTASVYSDSKFIIEVGGVTGGQELLVKTGESSYGGVSKIVSQDKLPYSGKFPVKVSIDPNKKVNDSNRANNEMTCWIDNVGNVDLIISDIQIYPPQGDPNTTFYFTFKVTNNGDRTAYLPTGSNVIICKGTGCEGIPAVTSPSGTLIPSKNTLTFQTVASGLKPGQRAMTFELDPGNHVVEASKNNNSKSAAFTVTNTPVDMSISAVILPGKTPPSYRDSLQVDVAVKNLSKTRAVFPQGSILINYGAQGFSTNRLALPAQLELSPGQEYRSTLSVPPFTVNAGAYTLQLLLDPANLMVDPKPENNRVFLPITLMNPGMTGTSAPASVTAPQVQGRTVPKTPASQATNPRTIAPVLKTPGYGR
jgi:subtilase family serine protease